MSPQEKMNEGVQLLIKRMDENPEEFADGGKWSRIVTNFPERWRDVLSADEINTVLTHLRLARREAFTAQVLRTLTGSENLQEKAYGIPVVAPGGGLVTTTGSNGTWANTSITSRSNP